MDLISCLSTVLVLLLACQLKLIESLPEMKNPMKRSLGRGVIDYASADWDRAPRKDEVPVLLEAEVTEEEVNSSPSTLIPHQSFSELDSFSEAEEDEVRDVREGFLEYDLPLKSRVAPASQPKKLFQAEPPGPVQDDSQLYIISTTLSPTPMVDFQSKAQLSYHQDCQVYGEHINEVQFSTEPLVEKKKKLGGEETAEYFGTQFCNFIPFHLECVPNDPRVIFTTPSPKQGVKDPNDPNAPVDNDEDAIFMPRPTGKCECLRAMGEEAFWFNVDAKDQSKCVIPADKGIHSNCGFDISFPYGEILDTSKSNKRSFPAADACTENSNCTSGYTYTGLRCHCNKGTLLLNSGKCVDSAGHKIQPGQSVVCISIIMVAASFLASFIPSV